MICNLNLLFCSVLRHFLYYYLCLIGWKKLGTTLEKWILHSGFICESTISKRCWRCHPCDFSDIFPDSLLFQSPNRINFSFLHSMFYWMLFSCNAKEKSSGSYSSAILLVFCNKGVKSFHWNTTKKSHSHEIYINV